MATDLSSPHTPTIPTILVVEDDLLVRMLAVEFLKECDFVVLTAGNAENAIALLNADGNIGAVFSDIQMPGSMDGVGLADWISREKSGVKVLLTSGKMVEQPAGPFLRKPYELVSVAERLKQMVDH